MKHTHDFVLGLRSERQLKALLFVVRILVLAACVHNIESQRHIFGKHANTGPSTCISALPDEKRALELISPSFLQIFVL